MKAFLIDPYARTVSEVAYNGDYHQIYEFIDCDTFDCARFDENGDGVFINDNGLIDNSPKAFFVVDGYPQPLTGKGLVLGCDDNGESTEPRVTLEELRQRVHFLTARQAIVFASTHTFH